MPTGKLRKNTLDTPKNPLPSTSKKQLISDSYQPHKAKQTPVERASNQPHKAKQAPVVRAQKNPLNIRKIKAEIHAALEKYIASDVKLSPADDATLEQQGYVLSEHAAIARQVCQKRNIAVSFRNSGQYTLEKMRAGNPCKGHDILDKTIKESPFRKALGKDKGDEQFKKYQNLSGLVADQLGKTKANGQIQTEPNELWSYDSKTKANKKVPLTLKDGQYGLNGDARLDEIYTGDYDLHDFLKNGQRSLDTSEIELFNQRLLQGGDPTRKKKVDQTSEAGRTLHSPYSPIRHGAQTSFVSFLLSEEGVKEIKVPKDSTLPFENAVLNIDDTGIAFFNEKGNAYILDSIEKIYHFYSHKQLADGKKLLDEIPFYFFFKALRKTKFNEEVYYDEQNRALNKLEVYSDYINGIISNSL